MAHCVYVAENLINGKKYVGYTHDLENRWLEHIYCSRKERASRSHFHSAIAKYGPENFKVSILEGCDSMESGLLCEIKWIAELNTYVEGYNSTLGGDGVRQPERSERHRANLSAALKGKTPWNKGKKTGSTGFKHSTESRRLMSERKKGVVFTDEHRAKLREAWKRRKEKGLSMGGRPKKVK